MSCGFFKGENDDCMMYNDILTLILKWFFGRNSWLARWGYPCKFDIYCLQCHVRAFFLLHDDILDTEVRDNPISVGRRVGSKIINTAVCTALFVADRLHAP